MSEQKKLHRVRIVNNDGVGYKTKITHADTGEEIPGVFRMAIIEVNKVITAQIDSYASLDIIADAEIKRVYPQIELLWQIAEDLARANIFVPFVGNDKYRCAICGYVISYLELENARDKSVLDVMHHNDCPVPKAVDLLAAKKKREQGA